MQWVLGLWNTFFICWLTPTFYCTFVHENITTNSHRRTHLNRYQTWYRRKDKERRRRKLEWWVERRKRSNGGEHTFALQRRSEVGVIVTITTGGPVAMETGGSRGWVRDKRENTHIHTHQHSQLGLTYTYIYPHQHALTQGVTRRHTLTVWQNIPRWGSRWHMPGRGLGRVDQCQAGAPICPVRKQRNYQ